MRRVEVALTVGDVYSRTNQAEKEFALYKDLLKELAAKADGVRWARQVAHTANRLAASQRALCALRL